MDLSHLITDGIRRRYSAQIARTAPLLGVDEEIVLAWYQSIYDFQQIRPDAPGVSLECMTRNTQFLQLLGQLSRQAAAYRLQQAQGQVKA